MTAPTLDRPPVDPPGPPGPGSNAMHLSTLRLHQLRLGELAGPADTAARAHAATCAACAQRLRHQESTRAEFVLTPVPAALQAAQPEPARDWQAGWTRAGEWWAAQGRSWAIGLVPMAALLLVGVSVMDSPVSNPGGDVADADSENVGSEGNGVTTEDGVRVKGHVNALEAWVQSGTSARPLYSNESLRAGSRLQLRYNPGKHRFVTLAGRDGSGRVELYGTLTATGPGPQTAPFSLTLDDTHGDQHFYAILTDQRLASETLVRSLAAEPVAVEGAVVETLVVPKE